MQTLMNCGSIWRAFEPPDRREAFSISHHAEVVALPPKQREKLLDKAEVEEMTVRQLRAEVAQTRAAIHSQELSKQVKATHRQPAARRAWPRSRGRAAAPRAD
jgi:hypothetical protein